MAGKNHKTTAGKQGPTPDQRRAQREIALLSEAWNNLLEDERQAWDEKSRRMRLKHSPQLRHIKQTSMRIESSQPNADIVMLSE